ncbi:MFS transporter [Sphingomonas panacis]|uniref:MFS transporter n=1 Tax=Sphingomonas panacis TaxID=1560345 RepID=UPI0009F5F260|nr:MFS transporter [Sphingomonas panacis]
MKSSSGLPILAVAFPAFLSLLGSGVVVPLLPLYGRSFGSEPWLIAVLFSAYAIGAIFGEPYWGRLSDQIGRKRVLILTLSMSAVCWLALSFSGSVLLSVFIRVVTGFVAGNNSVLQGYVSDRTSGEQRLKAISILSATSHFGFMAGPVLGGLLVGDPHSPLGYKTVFLTCTVLAILAAFLMAIILPNENNISQSKSKKMIWRAIPKETQSLIGLTFLYGTIASSIEVLFSLWANHEFGWGAKEIGLFFAFSALVAAITQLIIIPLWMSRISFKTGIIIGFAGVAFSTLGQLIANDVALAVSLMAFTSLARAISWAFISTRIATITENSDRGAVLGQNASAFAIARVIGPILAGLLATATGSLNPFILPTILLAAAAMVVGRVVRMKPDGDTR